MLTQKYFYLLLLLFLIFAPHASLASSLSVEERAQLEEEILQKVMNKLEQRIEQEVEKRLAERLAVHEDKKKSDLTTDNPQKVIAEFAPGPKIRTEDGAFEFAVQGRGQLDLTAFDDDLSDRPTDTKLRRIRLGVKGSVSKDWHYKMGVEFANDDASIRDGYVAYTGFENTEWKLGHFRESFGLDGLTSSLHQQFVERNLTDIFNPNRNLGLQAKYIGDHWTATLGAFGDGLGTEDERDEQFSLTSRLTYAPFTHKEKSLHFGIAASHRLPSNPDDNITFATQPEVNIGDDLISINVPNVDDINLYGFEMAAAWQRFFAQGEYIRADIGSASQNFNFDGYYIQGGYFLTGETRPYDVADGNYGRLHPLHDFSLIHDGLGAWEIATRYSQLDLTDGSLVGGELETITLGLNWYPSAYTRVMFNYVMTDSDQNAVVPNDDPSAYLLRAQFDF